MNRTYVLIAATVLVSACTPLTSFPDPNPNSPAVPTAKEGMSPALSTTLAVEEMSVHHDATHRKDGVAMYQCPMHPEVTSTDPSQRCPKCNMKIDRPVKDGGTAKGHQDHEGHNQ